MEVFAEDLQSQLECLGDVIVVDAEAGDQGLGVSAARADAGLLLVEKLAADALVIVHVQELSLLLSELLKDPLAVADLAQCKGGSPAEIVGDGSADRLAFGLAERNALVVVLDGRFHEVDWLVALGTVAMLVLRADEVSLSVKLV